MSKGGEKVEKLENIVKMSESGEKSKILKKVEMFENVKYGEKSNNGDIW